MASSDLDTCLRLVADPRRRKLVRKLRHETDGQTTIDELVTELHQEESRSDHDRSPTREQVTTQLYHVHLPKLADHGVVEYDPETGTVRYQPHEQIEATLDALPENAPHVNF